MKIIILGAGQVGGSLARQLVREEKHDITVIDCNHTRLIELQEHLDIRTICGHASFPNILDLAGTNDADILIATTNNDEVNMIACQIAYTQFNTPTRIARIRQTNYLTNNQLFQPSAIPIDVLISPEELIMQHIKLLIEYPGSQEVIDFAYGKIQLVSVCAYYGGSMIGKEIQALEEYTPDVNMRIVAIFRNNKPVLVNSHTVIEADDEVFFIAQNNHIKKIIQELRSIEQPYHRIFIAGGGNIGLRVAQALESKYYVKIVEANRQRCEYLANFLDKTIVLNGNTSDKDLLINSNIDNADIFIALTNDDEANIMSSILAKRLGVRQVISLINNYAYIDLMKGSEIDIVISPQLITTSDLLKHVRRGDVVKAHTLRCGTAEAIEAIAHGDERSSRVVGLQLGELNLPRTASIGAIVRNKQVIMSNNDLKIESNDHIILFLTDKKKISYIEKLFEVGIAFF